MALSEQELVRRNSLNELRKLGIDPYPAEGYKVNVTAQEIKEKFPQDDSLFQKVSIAGRIIKTGIIDIIVDAIPTVVCFTAKSERYTPIKGPKNAPMVINFIAPPFVLASLTFPQRLIKVIRITKPTLPAIILIWVAAKTS